MNLFTQTPVNINEPVMNFHWNLSWMTLNVGLVHRFVNNYTNRVECGFECAGKKRKRSGLRRGFSTCTIGFAGK